MSMVSCKECKAEKLRVAGPKRGRTQLWLDEQGRQWSGYSCSPCASKKIEAFIAQGRAGITGKAKREVMTQVEYARQGIGPAEPLYATKLRPCGTCGIMNKNYFTCSACIAHREWWQPDTYVGCIEEDMYGSSF